MTFRTSAIGGSFALEVQGVNLWETPSEETISRLRDLWSQHGVLVFRRQSLSETELIDFSAHFGEVIPHTRPDWASAHAREITLVSNMKNADGAGIGGLGNGELAWHSDQSFVEYPATGCLLYAVELPPDNPDTSWANLMLAYAALPADLRQAVDTRAATFDYAKRASGYAQGDAPSASISARLPPVRHPLVNAHPVTGKRSLYLDPGTMTGVDGLPEAEGLALLDKLTEAATAPAFTYRHQWRIGDVVMWDNGFLLHRRDGFSHSGNRLMKRTIMRLPRSSHICPGPA
ncbi:MAG: TauD/TfdA family dioxygenase [Gammaproteobacteria bacterium]|nr:TauD/TfdA family dioxygenase [Gammaproteobacteria bacterium]